MFSRKQEQNNQGPIYRLLAEDTRILKEMTEKLESIDWHGNVAQGMLDAMVHGYIYALMNATEALARIVRALLGRCSNYIAEVCGPYRNKVPYRRRLRDNVLFYGPTSLLFRSATLLLRQGAIPPLDGDLSNVGLISRGATISDVFSRWAAGCHAERNISTASRDSDDCDKLSHWKDGS